MINFGTKIYYVHSGFRLFLTNCNRILSSRYVNSFYECRVVSLHMYLYFKTHYFNTQYLSLDHEQLARFTI